VGDDRFKFRNHIMQKETPFSNLVKATTGPEDKILAYSFQNYEYIASDRLPASGHFFFLPWQQMYLNNPIKGFDFNPCMDLTEVKPKLLFIDKFDQWGAILKTPWGSPSYGECIQKIIDSEYTAIESIPNVFLHNGAKKLGLIVQHPPSKLETSNVLFINAPINARLISTNLNNLHSIGIMFGTFSKIHQGKAKILFKYESGDVIERQFDLASARDFEYTFFPTIPKKLLSVDVVALDGEGVTLWGTRDSMDNYFSCVVYKFQDDTKSFTPGCPYK